jgi:hypothetical protein
MSWRDFFDPSWENTNVVPIDADVLRWAGRWIKSCETCTRYASAPPGTSSTRVFLGYADARRFI